MAWPNNNFNAFLEAMRGSYGPPPHPSHGAGVHHAPPPPPPEFGQFMNPHLWNSWAQGGPSHGPWGHGRPHDRHAHGRGGGRYGRPHHAHHSGEDEAAAHGSPAAAAHDATDDSEAFPPEYISDDEVAAATAGAEAESKKGKGAAGDKDGSPDTLMQDDAEDPPEEIPTNPGEEDEPGRPRHCGGGRHGRRGGRGPGFGREGGFGGPRHRRGGARGPHSHHHGGPPPPPFGGPFGAFGRGVFGETRRHSRGPHGPHHAPPPPPPFFEGLFGPPRGAHGHHHGPPPPPPPGGAFDLRGLMAALANHPAAQQVREYMERLQQGGQGAAAGGGNIDHRDVATPGSSDDEDGMDTSFSPPLDLFEQVDRWVLHLALPGAKKEDLGVNWDAERSVLSVSGVVYRPGNEQLLQGLVSGERSVGLFSREVRLPPVDKEAKEEVDGDGIEAKMEEGVLVITVPKVEKVHVGVKCVVVQ